MFDPVSINVKFLIKERKLNNPTILYSKEQASKLKQSFWTTFGQYMVSVPSADGIKINWIKSTAKYSFEALR